MAKSSPTQSGFADGVLCGILLMWGASATHWLITPFSHAEASTARHRGVIAQAVVGYGGALLLFLRARRASRRLTPLAGDKGPA